MSMRKAQRRGSDIWTRDMLRGPFCVLAACFLWAGTARGAATTYYVTIGTPSHTEAGTVGDPFHSIQDGINTAATNDPAGGYHTISIAAGTYNRGEEETRQVASNNEPYLINIDGAIAGTTYLNNLHIVGAGMDSTIIDAAGSSNGSGANDLASELGVIRIANVAGGVVIRNLTVTGGAAEGKDTTGAANVMAAGVDAYSKVVLSSVKVTGNVQRTRDANYYGIVLIQGNATNSIIEYSQIVGNSISDDGGGIVSFNVGGAADSKLFIANTTIADNSGARGYGLANSYHGSYGAVLFGCLICRNAQDGLLGSYPSSDSPVYNLYNCTVADNSGYGWRFHGDAVRIMNSVFTGNHSGDAGYQVNNSGADRPSRFLNSNIDDTTWTFGGNSVDGFGSVAPITGTNPTNAANLARAGSPATTPQKYYALTVSSPGFDTGRVADGTGDNGSFRYLDLGNDGTFDPSADIVVAGNAPSNAARVYTTDLAGNRRVRVKSIDMGAYESQPPQGTVIIVR